MNKITSIESYLAWVRSCKTAEVPADNGKQSLTFEQYHLFFRGQANKKWNLIPSVFRSNDSEYSLLRNAYRYAWKYLQYCSSDLERMIVLQHYGLHTRLLDLTSNPLIALYFACADDKEKKHDGIVFCYCSNGKDNYENPQLIASMIMRNTQDADYYDAIIEQEYSSITGMSDFDSEKFHVWKNALCTPHFFLSPLNNERITAQRGAFIIAPLTMSDTYDMRFDDQIINGMRGWHPNRAIIAAKSKDSILDELALCGIDVSTVYPDLEHLLMFLNEHHKPYNRYTIHI